MSCTGSRHGSPHADRQRLRTASLVPAAGAGANGREGLKPNRRAAGASQRFSGASRRIFVAAAQSGCDELVAAGLVAAGANATQERPRSSATIWQAAQVALYDASEDVPDKAA